MQVKFEKIDQSGTVNRPDNIIKSTIGQFTVNTESKLLTSSYTYCCIIKLDYYY